MTIVPVPGSGSWQPHCALAGSELKSRAKDAIRAKLANRLEHRNMSGLKSSGLCCGPARSESCPGFDETVLSGVARIERLHDPGRGKPTTSERSPDDDCMIAILGLLMLP